MKSLGLFRSVAEIAVAAGALLVASCSPSARERCREHEERFERCGYVFVDPDICGTAEGRCIVACNLEASCKELDDYGIESDPPRVSHCLERCFEPFTCADDGVVIDQRWVCDAEQDCLDGSDEADCEYFECDNGQLVSADDECDRWADCRDRSDETSCSYFLCLDNSDSVSKSSRCDGNMDCEDSDEEDCL